jgi:hypothetical protein
MGSIQGLAAGFRSAARRRAWSALAAAGVVAGLALAPAASAASWHIVPTPSTATGMLTDVSASSATNVWAVGGDAVLRWNGSRLARVTVPAIESPMHIVAFSPTDVLVQGSERVARWDGFSWHLMPVTQSFSLFNISARSASDVWVIGTAPFPQEGCAISHWDGSFWTDVQSSSVCTPDATYSQILEISPSSVWLAGWETDHPGRVISAHWDGASWSPAFAPISGFASLNGMGGAAGQIWVAGHKTNREGSSVWSWAAKLNTSQAWNRIGYTPEWDAAGALHRLNDIDAHASDSAWGVGQRDNDAGVRKTWTVHWNGTSWVDLGGPNAGTADSGNVLLAVSIVPRTTSNVWAVGLVQDAGQPARPLVLNWN